MNPGGQSSRRLRVFLCHDSADKPWIRELRSRLEDRGFATWLDEEELLAGQDWQLEIARAVRAVDVVIVFLSRSSVGKAGFVQREIKHALDVADEQPEGTIFLIPAKLEECETPGRLRRWHWVNLFEEGGYERLVAALEHRAASLGLSFATQRVPLREQEPRPTLAPPIRKQEPKPTPPAYPKPPAGNEAKVCMIGATSVGKTSLVARFVHTLFSAKYLTTVGVKIDRKDVDLDARRVRLLIWDLEGRDSFQELRVDYIRGAHGLFFVADGTRRATLKDLTSMASSLEASFGRLPRVIVLNKADLEAEWEIHANDVDALRAESTFVIRTSAKSGLGVEDAFRELARRIFESGSSGAHDAK